MIGVVVLFSRPWLGQMVLENFERQLHADKTLIVVENGRALGHWNGPGEVVLSEARRTHARNAGLEACRAYGLEHYAIFEDDDWYGPGYLSDCWANRDRADVLGKGSWVIEDPTGKYWRALPSREPGFVKWQPGFVGGLLAGTLFGKTERALPFLEVNIGEEVVWYTDMINAGRSLWKMGPEHFRQIRYINPEHGHALGSANRWVGELEGLQSVELTENQVHDLNAN